MRSVSRWVVLAIGWVACSPGVTDDGANVEDCDDGTDNDGNGYRDCQDPACETDPACIGGDGGSSDGGATDGGATDGGGSDWPTLAINEFMASNASTAKDETGAYPDWFELYNPGTLAVALDGWTVTDDRTRPDKFELADLVVLPGDFLLLYADEDIDQGPRHVGFALDMAGEDLGLYAPDGTQIDLLEYDPQLTDISAARVPDGSAHWVLTDAPTPGESNGT